MEKCRASKASAVRRSSAVSPRSARAISSSSAAVASRRSGPPPPADCPPSASRNSFFSFEITFCPLLEAARQESLHDRLQLAEPAVEEMAGAGSNASLGPTAALARPRPRPSR
jgi:hypothetical protein